MKISLQTESEQAAIETMVGYLGEDSRDQAAFMVGLAWYCTVKGTTGDIPVVTRTLAGAEVAVIYQDGQYTISQ